MTDRLEQFFSANEQLLLPKEVVLRDRISANLRPQLLLYSSMHQVPLDSARNRPHDPEGHS
jgi:hypothetical protein